MTIDLRTLTAAVEAGNGGEADSVTQAALDEGGRVVAGGAPTTPEFAAPIGRDGRVSDGTSAAVLVRRLVGLG